MKLRKQRKSLDKVIRSMEDDCDHIKPNSKGGRYKVNEIYKHRWCTICERHSRGQVMNCPYSNPADCPAKCPHGIGGCFSSTVEGVKTKLLAQLENPCPHCNGSGGFTSIEGFPPRTAPGSRRICRACNGTGIKTLQEATNPPYKEEKDAI